MKKTIAILAGDGIGPEVMQEAVHVLKAIEEKFEHEFKLEEAAIGGAAFDQYGVHFPDNTRDICLRADAVLFGSVGGPVAEAQLPKWKDCEKNSILALRKTLQLAVNLRPVQVYPALAESCPLKDHVIGQGINIMVVRELLGDIYFGKHEMWQENNQRYARDVAEYNEQQIRTAAIQGFELALLRNKKLTSVDKANVLDTSKLWREVVTEVAADYPAVQLEHMLVDNCAMQLIIKPGQFDVIVTANLFGDILSDAAAALPGSLGLMPSASLSASSTIGLYEPAGGSAPDIAGKDIANPIAQILCVAMLLRHSFKLIEEAAVIEAAVLQTLKAGWRTRDIFTTGKKLIGTREMAEKVIDLIYPSP
jgi:3-isopropylmalate dehydrogenase